MPSSDYRIPNQMLVNNSLIALEQSFSKLSDLQSEASSLKKLSKPSDAPGDVSSAMQLHAGLDRNDQYTRNTSDALGWLGNADNALQSTVTQLQQVNALVLQATNASTDSNARAGIAAQIDSIRQSIIGVANTQYAGRPIFAGTAGGDVAYDSGGNFVGTSTAVERNIAPGQQIQVNVSGAAVFGPPGNDLFTTLTQISQAVANDPTQLTALQATLNTQTTQVQNQLAQVGSQYFAGPIRAEPKQFGWSDDETEPVQHRGRGRRAGDGRTPSPTSCLRVCARGHREGHYALTDRLLEVGTMLETHTATDVAEINFPAGLPGFPHAHKFDLAPWGPAGSPFLLLSSADDPDVGFVVVPPWVFYPTYEFELDTGAAERLGLNAADDAVVFAVVTLRDRPEDSTLNLLGPIVVNRYTHEAAQVVLPSAGYSVRAPLAVAS